MSWTDNVLRHNTPNNGKIADMYIYGIFAQSAMEDDLQEILNLSDDQSVTVGGDHYDWSLEIDISDVSKDFTITEEQAKIILDWGAHRFWINLYNNSLSKEEKIGEIHVYKDKDKDKIVIIPSKI